MYILFVILQVVGIVVLCGEVVYLVNQRPSRQQTRILLLMIGLLVNFTGYLFELLAGTQEEAILSVKFSYLGKPIIVLAMFLFVMDYCKVKMPRWLPTALCCLHIVIIFLAMSCDVHTLYYSSISYTQEGFAPHLILGHGPAYRFYHGMLVVYIIIMVIACLRRYVHVNSEVEKRRMKAFFSIIVVMVVGWLIYSMDLLDGYDTTLISYLVAVIIISVLLYKDKQTVGDADYGQRPGYG